jgi:hypothetical protein
VWGIPYLVRSFGAIAHKQKLLALDAATIDGMINRITIFKVGDPNNPATWSGDRLSALYALLSSPNASNMLVWSYDLEVEDVGPDGKVLEFQSRYNQADYDILSSLGIPINLFMGITKDRAASTDPWITLMAMIEKLEKLREQVQVYLESLLSKICKKNGYENVLPKIRWQRMNLRNVRELRTLVLALYDRGLLPVRDALEESNYNFDEMLKQRKTEAKEGIDKVFEIRPMPFQGSMMKQQQTNPSKDTAPGRPKKGEEPKNLPRSEVKTPEKDKKSVDGFQSAAIELYNSMYTDLIKRVDELVDNDAREFAVVSGFTRIAKHMHNVIRELSPDNIVQADRFAMYINGELDTLANEIMDDIKGSDVGVEDIMEDCREGLNKIIGGFLSL